MLGIVDHCPPEGLHVIGSVSLCINTWFVLDKVQCSVEQIVFFVRSSVSQMCPGSVFKLCFFVAVAFKEGLCVWAYLPCSVCGHRWVLALERKSWSSGLMVSTFTHRAVCWPMPAVGTEKWGFGVSLQFSQCLLCLLRTCDVALYVYNSFILLLIKQLFLYLVTLSLVWCTAILVHSVFHTLVFQPSRFRLRFLIQLPSIGGVQMPFDFMQTLQ